jgi:hypothetical protein
MFETVDYAELPIPKGLFEDGERLWQFVIMRLHVCWFYVIYETTALDDCEVSHIILLQNVNDLVEFSSVKEFKLIEAYLVSPKYINKKGNWKMEPLKEIWVASEPEFEQKSYIYVLRDGSRYVQATLCDSESQLIEKRLVFTT